MIFFIKSMSYARVGFPDTETATPWKTWFAWYPVNDMGMVYWLTWIKWRRRTSYGSLAGRPMKHSYIECKKL